MGEFFDFQIEQTLDDLANQQLPSPSLLDYYKRINNRVIYINDVIDTYIVNYTQNIIEWNREDKDLPENERKPIKIYINTDGGCVNSILEFITICNMSKTPVYMIGLGKCYSAGGYLLMSGKKGRRFILPTTEILVHDGNTGSVGDVGKVLDDLRYTEEIEVRIKKFVIDNTEISDKEYDKNYRRNWWIFAEEAIEKGIADKIITNIDDLL